MVLARGHLHIDDGRPMPGLVETVANLRSAARLHFPVPRGFDMLLPFLEGDEGFARDFFDNVQGIFCAGAALRKACGNGSRCRAARANSRCRSLRRGARPKPPAITHAGRSSGPAHRRAAARRELKFVPSGDKLEMRVRRPTSDLQRAGPDRQGLRRRGLLPIGDAGKLVSPEDPSQGVAFDGRVAEDFKLMSGTWVSVGTLRLRAVAALNPLAADVVVTGHDREEVGLLVFPSPAAKAMDPAERGQKICAALRALRAEGGGSSQAPPALMLAEPPSADAGEITDKGYINQRAVLARRNAEVIALYSAIPNPEVIRI
jgi:feruloyl-CoA synthase